MPKLPGYETLRSISPKEIAWGGVPLEFLPGGIILDGTNGIDGGNTGYTFEMRPGWALGRITATGLYVPCKRTTTTSTGAVTALVVVNSYAFKVGDVISIGADTTKTVSAVDYTTHTLTISSTTVASGEAVVAEDGSQTCVGFLADFQRLRNYDNSAAENKTANLVVGGALNQSYLLGDITAILADATSKAFIAARTRIFNPATSLYTV